jgi:paraquat-inducible protein B
VALSLLTPYSVGVTAGMTGGNLTNLSSSRPAKVYFNDIEVGHLESYTLRSSALDVAFDVSTGIQHRALLLLEFQEGKSPLQIIKG